MRDPVLTRLGAPSLRIVDLVFQAEPTGRWRRLALGGVVVFALYGGALALVSRLGNSLAPWSVEMAARIHDAMAMDRAVEVAPPPPPPPPSAPVVKASHIAVSRSVRVAHARQARATPPAQAGQLAAALSEPVDFTGTAFIVGSGTSYAGGTTTSRGTGRKAALGPAAVESVPARTRSRARSVALDQSAWNCPWPAEADAEQVNEQTVVLRVTVGADGRADHVDILSDSGFGFGTAARLCTLRTRFEPARDRTGRPIPAQSPPIRVHFYR